MMKTATSATVQEAYPKDISSMCQLMSNYRGSRADKKLDTFNDGVMLTQTVEQSLKKKKKKKTRLTEDSVPAGVEDDDDDDDAEDLLRQAVQTAWFDP
jgi:tRNA splicing ligase